jgi:glucokinase
MTSTAVSPRGKLSRTESEPADRMAEFWALGIEIGGTKLQLGIGQGQGSLLALERLRVDPSRGASGILDQIQTAFPALLAKTKLDRRQIRAVGIGFGGPIDGRQGQTQRSFQVSGWDDFPLVAWIDEHLGVPRVILENDADSAALAEARFGAGIGHSPLLYMNVGSGIGGALVVDQQIYRAAGQGAVEIGHLRVPDDTRSGIRVVELEQVASGWAIALAAQDLASKQIEAGKENWVVLARANGCRDKITASIVAEAALAADPDSLRVLNRAQNAIAFALTQAIALLAPRLIVMGGGVSLLGKELWFDPIRRIVDRDVFAPFRAHFDIVPAALGEEVVVHGALALARDASMESE